MVTGVGTVVAVAPCTPLSLRHPLREKCDGVGSDFTIVQHLDDAIAFIEAPDGKPADVMGHSRGGRIAFLVAQRPDLLRKPAGSLICWPPRTASGSEV
jgi:pimeloyl-ACP methyl ester carboxylesterase